MKKPTQIAKPKRVWGYVSGGNLYERAFFLDTVGQPNQEPWFKTKQGQYWSAYDVNFRPDNEQEFKAAYKAALARRKKGKR